jgi:hypothetical protein
VVVAVIAWAVVLAVLVAAHGHALPVLEHQVKVMMEAGDRPALELEQAVAAVLALWVEKPQLMAAEMAVLVYLVQLLVPLCFTLAAEVGHQTHHLELALEVAVLAVVAGLMVVVIHPQEQMVEAVAVAGVHLLGKMVLLVVLVLL